MKVTAIKQQVKNPDRASIFVDGKFSFSLSLSELVAEKIKIGLELEEPELKALKKISDDGKIKMKALNWVLLRPHSVREFQDYTWRKKIDPDLAASLTEEFIARKYLDDESFARWWVDTKRVSKKQSTKRLQQDLMQKGVARGTIDRILHDEQGSEKTALIELIEKKSRLPRYATDRQKLTQYLLRQGFGYDDIRSAFTDFDDKPQ